MGTILTSSYKHSESILQIVKSIFTNHIKSASNSPTSSSIANFFYLLNSFSHIIKKVTSFIGASSHQTADEILVLISNYTISIEKNLISPSSSHHLIDATQPLKLRGLPLSSRFYFINIRFIYYYFLVFFFVYILIY